MKRHWYVVAHRADARIFEQEGAMPALALIRTIENPKGRLQNSELTSDRQGVVPRRPGHGFNQYQPFQDAKEHELERFAKLLVRELSLAAQANQFDGFSLVAEPHLLGLLREELDAPLRKKLRHSVTKDLAHTPAKEMGSALHDSLYQGDRLSAS